MKDIICKVTPYVIRDWLVAVLPIDASKQLPSRSMTIVEGVLNGAAFQSALEPDGQGSHWFRIEDELAKTSGARAGQEAELTFHITADWPRPTPPDDLQQALAKEPAASAIWHDITPMAQWEWVRWIRAAKQDETRQRHIIVAISKMNKGMRRPCCFNRSMCSEPYVSNNWILRGPEQA